jgi:hypothetical protein
MYLLTKAKPVRRAEDAKSKPLFNLTNCFHTLTLIFSFNLHTTPFFEHKLTKISKKCSKKAKKRRR